MKQFSLILIALFGCLFSIAQTKSSMLIAPDTLLPSAVVTGSRINQGDKNSITSGNIVTISREQIAQIPAFSIDQILRFAGGVEIQSRNSFGAQSDLSIRGSTFTQVIVLVDGVRIFDPLTAHSNCYIPVAIEDIEEIQVIRGGASYIYGPDAMGGAINIITKTGSGKPLKNDSEHSAAIGLASYETHYFRGGIVQGYKKWKFSLAANTINAKGNQMATGLNNYFDLGTVSGTIAYEINEKNSILFRSGYDNRRYNAQYYYTIAPTDSAEASNETFFNQLSYIKTKNGGTHRRLDASWQRANGQFVFNGLTRPNQHKTDFIFIQGSENFDLARNLKLNAGFQADQKGINSNDRGVHTRNHAGVFTTFQYDLPAQQLIFEAGLRHDYDERGGHFTSPNFGVYKIINKGAIGVRIGRAYRVADFTELYVSHGLPAVANMRNFGNPNLGVENSYNTELSYTQKVKTTEFKGAAFYRKGFGMIDYTVTPGSEIPNSGNIRDSFNYFFPVNLSDVDFFGFEAGFTDIRKMGKFNLLTSLMYVRVNSTLQRGVFTKYISNHALDLAQMSFTINYDKKVDLNLSAFYKTRRPDESTNLIKPDSEILVLNVGANVWFMDQRIAAQFRIENLLDNRYRDVLGAEMAPRWFSFGIMIR